LSNKYDSRDHLFRTFDAEGNITNYEYDAASQLLNVADPDSAYSFDGASRLTDLTHEQNAATIAEFGLVYDQGDRITQLVVMCK